MPYNFKISQVDFYKKEIFLKFSLYHRGPIARKPVFGFSNKVRFKPVSSATETRKEIEIWLISSLDMILSKKRITKALINQRGCAGWSAPVLFANPR